MPAADWTNIFFNLAFNDAIADMDDAERQQLEARLREAIANCPDALGLESFWAHMQSCSDDEWDRTMARIGQVGRPAQRTRPPQRSGHAVCACARASAVSLP